MRANQSGKSIRGWKRIAAFVLCALMVITTACGNKETSVDVPAEAVKGRFVESILNTPELNYINQLVQRPDGLLEVFSESFYTSADGQNWEKEADPAWYAGLKDKAYMNMTALSPSGERYIVYTKISEQENPEAGADLPVLAKVSDSGTLTEIPIEWHVLSYDSEEAKPVDLTATPPPQNLPETAAAESGETTGSNEKNSDVATAQETPDPDAQQTEEETTADNTPAAENNDEAESANESDAAEEPKAESTVGVSEADSAQMAYYDSRPSPNRLIVLENGDLLIDDRNAGIIHYAADGKYIRAYMGGSDYAVLGNTLMMTSWQSASVERYDLKTGEKTQVELPEGVQRFNLKLGANQTNFYLIDNASIYSMPGAEAGGWTKVCEVGSTSLALSSIYIQSFLVTEKQEFIFAVQGQEGKAQIIKLAYEAEAVNPTVNLNVYTLNQNPIMRDTSVAFQQKYPEVRVNIEQVLTYDENSITGPDAIRALNTELLAGKGPDILVLDELPIDSYIEKGVLIDLSEIVRPHLENGEWYEGIAKSFETKSDQKIYAIPMSFMVPLMYGDKEALSEITTIKSLIAWAEKHPDERPFYYMAPQSMMYRFYAVSEPDFFEEDGSFKQAEFAGYLMDMQRLADTVKGKPDPAEASIQEADKQMAEYYSQSSEDPVYSKWTLRELQTSYEGLYEFSAKKNAFATETAYGKWALQSMFGFLKMRGDGGYAPLPGYANAGVFTPSTVLGVNANSSQQDYAKLFVEMAAQNASEYGGFSIKIDALKAPEPEKGETAESSASYTSTTINGKTYEMELSPLTKEQVNEFKEFCKKLTIASTVDDQIWKIIEKEAEPFFNAEQSAEQTAATIAQRLQIILSE